jgi:predicted nucleic acid-binding Zn ribbon protein
MTTSTPGAALAAMRPWRNVRCAVCGKVYQAQDTRACYCSNRCRQAAKYARQKAKRPDLA